MSHIPASAMPHAQAHDDQDAAGATQQADGRDPSPPEPTTATPKQPGLTTGGAAPLKNGDGSGGQAHAMGIAGATSSGIGGSNEPPLSSAAPGTQTGNRAGSDADRTAQAAGEPAATVTSAGQAPVQGDAEEQTPVGQSQTGGRSAVRTAGRAALALGGLAAIGGIIATVFPMVRDRNDGAAKGKKGKKRKA